MCSVGRVNVFSFGGDVFSFGGNVSSFRANVFTFRPNVFTLAGQVFSFRWRALVGDRGRREGEIRSFGKLRTASGQVLRGRRDVGGLGRGDTAHSRTGCYQNTTTDYVRGRRGRLKGLSLNA